MADEVAVMYGSFVVEYAGTSVLFGRPLHLYTYTWGLFQAIPRLDTPSRPLRPMRGAPPIMTDPPDQCPFLQRCSKATNRCRTGPRPELVEVEPDHRLACYNLICYATKF